jgi:four helix bundle protein
MSRDHRKLRVFHIADDLVVEVYRVTGSFPEEEKFGLLAQIRRAAVSAASNIVEGCARRGTREYLHFLNVATGSAGEAQYLVDLAGRLDYVSDKRRVPVSERYGELLRSLQKLITSLDRVE